MEPEESVQPPEEGRALYRHQYSLRAATTRLTPLAPLSKRGAQDPASPNHKGLLQGPYRKQQCSQHPEL